MQHAPHAAPPHALTDVLDRLDSAGKAETVSLAQVVETIGPRSLAALMLIFALISISPLSVVPGVTTFVALLELILVVQMIAGRRHLWLPDMVSRRSMEGQRLRGAIDWLRGPVAFVERFLRPRLAPLTEKPLLYPWLFLILGLTLIMPFMELVPGSGTLASAVIALIAAAILTRDGAVLMLALMCLGGMVWVMRWLGETVL